MTIEELKGLKKGSLLKGLDNNYVLVVGMKKDFTVLYVPMSVYGNKVEDSDIVTNLVNVKETSSILYFYNNYEYIKDLSKEYKQILLKVKLINEDIYIGRILSLEEISKELVTTPTQITRIGQEYKLLPLVEQDEIRTIKRLDSTRYEIQENGSSRIVSQENEIVQKGICILDVRDERVR